MTPTWQGVPERSNLFWLNTITWIALKLGRLVADLLLYPITSYFVFFSDRTRTDSLRFFRRVLDRDCDWRDVFHHYHTMAWKSWSDIISQAKAVCWSAPISEASS